MALEDEIKRIIKELTNLIDENIDVKDEKWHIHLCVGKYELRKALNILKEN